MKIRIGPYRNWLGPYQLAEKIMFWVPKEKDEYGFPHTAERVHRFGEWLAHGNIKPKDRTGDERKLFDDDRKETLLYRFLSWVYSKQQRKISVVIEPWDTWSMDATLGYIIRPMLLQLQASKHGSPWVDDEDVPEELRSTSAPPLENEYDTDDNHHKRWDWVLDEIIFAFDSLDGGPNEDWERQFTKGKYDLRLKKISDDGTSEVVHGPNHTAYIDWDARKAYAERIQNGFRLFGKYYQSLWD